ncbi:hypothetical protein AB0D84_14395 [Streptomyces sp. NPDC048193]|uniref:hypothetical protein n=1 Tax=unclassified Streptomyces TaxID=2593676 RepID=UPI00341A0235
MNGAVRAAITCRAENREVDLDAYAGPVSVIMHGVRGEDRARELAAAFHAALYGDLGRLTRAVPPVS